MTTDDPAAQHQDWNSDKNKAFLQRAADDSWF